MLTRRTFLGGIAITAAVAFGAYAFWPGARQSAGVSMTPPEALAAARDGSVILVDIRRPEEWQTTGLAEGAVPIDMRRSDFISALQAEQGNSARPVALICARGVRSRRLAAALTDAGLSGVIDVPEGMLGSRAGPGWIARDLPVVPWSG
ncbi:rhodanese-like domain-containing protein [Marivita hallyeonensis]|uniref:Tat (Twin-arginine translocation) pathway signal sequence n=1 Tax=Marivita hallyeonensis TaxID=996342 RepID=A0A1M5XCR8_9RHOB|nr:rhodanese-like domain-containing protein [Marivita hallyeonensis]SHH97566.1 Tat (twin-arginine translocation) pathway signal sequence [Marivita hallyeonensis]